MKFTFGGGVLIIQSSDKHKDEIIGKLIFLIIGLSIWAFPFSPRGTIMRESCFVVVLGWKNKNER
jgi:hypothetical protein